MARHRNVRGYNYDEDFEDDDLYGQSVEDDYCISPSTAAQFIYSRRDKPPSFVEPVEEYDYEDTKESANSVSNHQLSGIDQARLYSCLDHMREVLGNDVSDQKLIEAVLQNKFDVQKALAMVLDQDKKQATSEDAVSIGKATKGVLFCSSEVPTDNVQSFFPSSVNHSGCSRTPFEFCDSVPKDGLSCNSSVILSHHLLHKKKKLDRPHSDKKLESCKSSKELSLANLINDMPHDSFYESHNSQPAVKFSSKSDLESLISDSVDGKLLEPDSSESLSLDDSKYKGGPDLKPVMQTKRFDNSLSFGSSLQNIPIQNNLESIGNSFYLTNTLENMTLDNNRSHIQNKKAELFGSVLSARQCSKKHNLEKDWVHFSKCENPSLTELFQEHKENNPNQYFSLSDLCNQSSASFSDMNLGSTPLSQITQYQTGIPELTGSLSSLAFSKASPTRDLENLSLSDLIAESINEVDKSQIIKDSSMLNVPEIKSSSVDSNIDLSVLIKTPESFPKPIENQSNILIPGVKVPSSKLVKNSNFSKENKKNKKGFITRKPAFSLSWTKALAARPSAFASTLCLRYPPKTCKRHTFDLYKTFLYSRQVQEVKDKEIGPLKVITPFDFKSASPDDIVKANQKKAFTRE
ncbi:HBS1-like protein isoform X3 [Monodelphis domestica]|uniref:HBS1-like protein N-terminal domain-containing protein n=2 Tax=Monodelphis domestica TaxID=13616 RepID=A0A5F8H1V3_MONDO|nr:HBS1-like protein isoform X3 [Monodelphis domestica]